MMLLKRLKKPHSLVLPKLELKIVFLLIFRQEALAQDLAAGKLAARQK